MSMQVHVLAPCVSVVPLFIYIQFRCVSCLFVCCRDGNHSGDNGDMLSVYASYGLMLCAFESVVCVCTDKSMVFLVGSGGGSVHCLMPCVCGVPLFVRTNRS